MWWIDGFLLGLLAGVWVRDCEQEQEWLKTTSASLQSPPRCGWGLKKAATPGLYLGSLQTAPQDWEHPLWTLGGQSPPLFAVSVKTGRTLQDSCKFQFFQAWKDCLFPRFHELPSRSWKEKVQSQGSSYCNTKIGGFDLPGLLWVFKVRLDNIVRSWLI